MTLAFKFHARVEPGKPLCVPGEIQDQLPPGAHAQVILLVDAAEPEDASLALQSAALHTLWDDPAEDIYGEV